MVVKINNKPILVQEDNNEEKTYSWVYWCVSGVGYLLLFWVLDFSCFTFIGTHPFPFVKWVGFVLGWIGGLL